MLDRLEWWQVLLALAPVVALLNLVRYREAKAASTQFADLTPPQKAWVLLMLLPPGGAARLLGRLAEEDLRAYVVAGGAIRGSGRNLVRPVLKAFLASLPPNQRKQAGGNLEEQLACLGRWSEEEPDQLLEWLIGAWPPGSSTQDRAARTAPAEVAATS
ncbi:MAG: hypothetical protein AB1758_24780 [Candidatus Eremiobacterota bacterium]